MKALLACVALASSLASIEAKTIYVRAGSATPVAPFSAWFEAAADLQSALALATAGDQIWVAAGTYFPDEGTGQTANSRSSTFALIGGVEIYGGFGGTETSLSQRAPATHVTVLSGDLDQNDGPNFTNNSNNAYHVVWADAGVLDGFTIMAGNASGGSQNSGGGIFSAGGSPVIRHCSFTGNNADQGGGGYIGYDASFINCSFSGNRATGVAVGAAGGGIYIIQGPVSLTNCAISGNFSSDAGAGIFTAQGATLTLTNCSIVGNHAEGSGSAIYNLSSSVSVTNCIVWNNLDVIDISPSPAASWTFSHSLVEGLNLTAATGGNLDGTLPANDPQFFISADPLSAPSTAGNFRLQPGSPAIDVGDGVSGSSANTQAYDRTGKPRFINGANPANTIAAVIDLGAFEDNPLDRDYDLDGIADGAEVKLTSFGFIIGVDDSAKRALIQANALGLGLYTPASLQTLAVGRPVISRDPGSGLFQLRTQLLRSPDLVTPFVPFSTFTATRAVGSSEILLEFAAPSPDAHFFQIQVGN